MKKIVYTATVLLVLASSSASALTFQSTAISAKGSTTTTKEPAPDSGTSVVPGCPRNDPNGCGILD